MDTEEIKASLNKNQQSDFEIIKAFIETCSSEDLEMLRKLQEIAIKKRFYEMTTEELTISNIIHHIVDNHSESNMVYDFYSRLVKYLILNPI
jgi:hypothetical protein